MLSLILRKAIAFLIDYSIVSISFMLVATGLVLLFGTQDPNDVNTIHFSPGLGVGLLIFYLLLFICYPAFAEYKYQCTIGHKIVGLKIHRVDGAKMTFATALKRRSSDVIEIMLTAGFLALILNLATDGYRRLGDLWAGTVVIETNTEHATAYSHPTKID